jgi:hypothetical protein
MLLPTSASVLPAANPPRRWSALVMADTVISLLDAEAAPSNGSSLLCIERGFGAGGEGVTFGDTDDMIRQTVVSVPSISSNADTILALGTCGQLLLGTTCGGDVRVVHGSWHPQEDTACILHLCGSYRPLRAGYHWALLYGSPKGAVACNVTLLVTGLGPDAQRSALPLAPLVLCESKVGDSGDGPPLAVDAAWLVKGTELLVAVVTTQRRLMLFRIGPERTMILGPFHLLISSGGSLEGTVLGMQLHMDNKDTTTPEVILAVAALTGGGATPGNTHIEVHQYKVDLSQGAQLAQPELMFTSESIVAYCRSSSATGGQKLPVKFVTSGPPLITEGIVGVQLVPEDSASASDTAICVLLYWSALIAPKLHVPGHFVLSRCHTKEWHVLALALDNTVTSAKDGEIVVLLAQPSLEHGVHGVELVITPYSIVNGDTNGQLNLDVKTIAQISVANSQPLPVANLSMRATLMYLGSGSITVAASPPPLEPSGSLALATVVTREKALRHLRRIACADMDKTALDMQRLTQLDSMQRALIKRLHTELKTIQATQTALHTGGATKDRLKWDRQVLQAHKTVFTDVATALGMPDPASIGEGIISTRFCKPDTAAHSDTNKTKPSKLDKNINGSGSSGRADSLGTADPGALLIATAKTVYGDALEAKARVATLELMMEDTVAKHVKATRLLRATHERQLQCLKNTSPVSRETISVQSYAEQQAVLKLLHAVAERVTQLEKAQHGQDDEYAAHTPPCEETMNEEDPHVMTRTMAARVTQLETVHEARAAARKCMTRERAEKQRIDRVAHEKIQQEQAAYVERLKERLRVNAEKYTELQSAFAAQTKDCARLEAVCAARTEDCARLEAVCAARTEDCARLEAVCAARTEDCARLEAVCAARTEDCARLEAVCAARTEDCARLEAVCAARTEDCARLEAVCAARTEDCARLEAVCAARTEDCTRLEAVCAARTEDCARLEATHTEKCTCVAQSEKCAQRDTTPHVDHCVALEAANTAWLEAARTAWRCDRTRLEYEIQTARATVATLEQALAKITDDTNKGNEAQWQERLHTAHAEFRTKYRLEADVEVQRLTSEVARLTVLLGQFAAMDGDRAAIASLRADNAVLINQKAANSFTATALWALVRTRFNMSDDAIRMYLDQRRAEASMATQQQTHAWVMAPPFQPHMTSH